MINITIDDSRNLLPSGTYNVSEQCAAYLISKKIACLTDVIFYKLAMIKTPVKNGYSNTIDLIDFLQVVEA